MVQKRNPLHQTGIGAIGVSTTVRENAAEETAELITHRPDLLEELTKRHIAAV
ncbi:hypothetical protein Hthe01_19730 [Hydrogenophilus thermoluteolus]|nr:hypothetical protein Hthe01_19730 [Hydrogenophilus thermoluteolus]